MNRALSMPGSEGPARLRDAARRHLRLSVGYVASATDRDLEDALRARGFRVDWSARTVRQQEARR